MQKREQKEKKLVEVEEALRISNEKLSATLETIKKHETESMRKDQAEAYLTSKLEELQSEITRLTSPGHFLLVIRNWGHNHNAFTLAAKHAFGRAFLRGCGFTRRKVLNKFPNADLNDFRAFPTECIKTNKETLFRNFFPLIFSLFCYNSG